MNRDTNYDFKVIRQSLFEWYPMSGSDRVLVVNDNEGFVAELFSSRCKCDESSHFQDLLEMRNNNDKYDIVIMYDLYAFCIESDTDIKTVIDTLVSLKSDNGAVLLAMENKLGLKYFAGCREEQKGEYFVGIEDYHNWNTDIRPLSKKEIEDIIKSLDVSYKFYYPYPDYKYPTMIYSDNCLPKEGELFRNIRNIDRERYVILDERRTFDSIIKAGLFPELANSFLIEITDRDNQVQYTKYSTDRDKRFAIRTDRLVDEDNNAIINKHALFQEGKKHLDHMIKMGEILSERYKDTIIISKSTLRDNALNNEFVSGKPYEKFITDLIDHREKDKFLEELNLYINKIYFSSGETKPFSMTPEFIEVFGEHEALNDYDLKSDFVTDIDMVFENIIVSESGQWQLIDYEWTFDFPIPREYVLFRTLHYLYNSTEIAALIPWVEMMEYVGIEPPLEKCFRDMEQHFQDFVLGETMTIDRLINSKATPKAAFLDEIISKYEFYDEGVMYMNAYKQSEHEKCSINMQYKALQGEYKNLCNKAEDLVMSYNELKDDYIREKATLTGIVEGRTYKFANKLKNLKR